MATYTLHELVRFLHGEMPGLALDHGPKWLSNCAQEMMKLLRAEADVNERDYTRTTPLGYCINVQKMQETLSQVCYVCGSCGPPTCTWVGLHIGN